MCTAGQRVSLTITGPGPSFERVRLSFFLSLLMEAEVEAEAVKKINAAEAEAEAIKNCRFQTL